MSGTGRMNRPTNTGRQLDGGDQAEMIDLGQFLASVSRRWKIIAAAVICCGLAALLVGLFKSPMYTGQAVIMLLPPHQDKVIDNSIGTGDATQDPGMVLSEIEVMSSRTLAGRAVDKLHLAQEAPTARGLFAFGIRVLKGAQAVKSSPTLRRELAVDDFMANTNIRRRQTSYVIEINLTATSPAEAQLRANTLADLYLDWQLESRYAAARRANAWLGERTSALKIEVEQKEAAVEAFRAQTGLLRADGTTLTERQISDIQTAVLSARTDLAEKTARLNQVTELVKSGGSPETIGAVLNSDTIRALRDREVEASRHEGELALRYGPSHPELQKAHAERQNIETQIKAELNRIVANLQNEVDVVRTRLNTLNDSLAVSRGTLVENNSAEVRLRELERDVAAARDVYEGYLKRFQEISDQASLKALDARIVSYAPMPRTTGGLKVYWLVAFGLVGGLLLGGLVAFAAEMVDDRLDTVDEVERRTGISPIVSIPILGTGELARMGGDNRNPAGYLVRFPISAFAEATRVLRSAIRHARASEPRIGVVAIASALPAEGKTSVSLCLARSAAMAGQKVLLIDCDLRRHSVQKFVDVEPSAGITDALAEGANWRVCLIEDPATPAKLMLVRSGDTVMAESLDSPAMKRLLSEARQEYDLVILDCPPTLAVAEARSLAEMADATVLIVKSGRASARAVRAALRQLDDAGANVLGIVLNAINPRVAGRFSYGDALYYSKVQDYYFSK